MLPCFFSVRHIFFQYGFHIIFFLHKSWEVYSHPSWSLPKCFSPGIPSLTHSGFQTIEQKNQISYIVSFTECISQSLTLFPIRHLIFNPIWYLNSFPNWFTYWNIGNINQSLGTYFTTLILVYLFSTRRLYPLSRRVLVSPSSMVFW